MVSLPSINIGLKARRSHFNLQHDVETTADFGYCQPTINRMFIKDTKIKLTTKSVTRFSPMPCPTFGRVEIRTHTAWVPMSEIYPAFDFQQSQKSISSAVRTYTPAIVDNILPLQILWTMFGRIQSQVISKQDWINDPGVRDTIPFRISFQAREDAVIADSDLVQGAEVIGGMRDILNDERILSDSVKTYNGIALADSIWAWFCENSGYIPQDDDGPIAFTPSGSISSLSDIPLQLLMSKVPSRKLYAVPGLVNYNYDEWSAATAIPSYSSFSGYPGSSGDQKITYNTSVIAIDNDVSRGHVGFWEPMSLENADFRIFVPANSLSYNAINDEDGTELKDVGSFYICIHLTPFGKRLFGKVFSCAKLYFGELNKEKSILPLLANYKVWFDKYNPGRNVQWRETPAYKLIHSYYDTGVPLSSIYTAVSSAMQYDTNDIRVMRRKAFWDFLCDLGQMYYSLKPDNITAATPDVLLQSDETNVGMDNILMPGGPGQFVNPQVSQSTDPYGIVNNELSGGPTGLGVMLLQRLYHLVNKNSVIGSKVDEYLRVNGISNGLPETHVLGDDKYMVDIDEVFATVNNDQSFLGEYAGRALGGGTTKPMTYETNSYGFLIQMLCVVPLGGYCQDGCHDYLTRYDFYNSAFDSLGKQAMSYSEFLGRTYDLDISRTPSTFGFLPRYFDLKIQNNTSLGGFALRGSQAQFLSYTLNRLFNVSDSFVTYQGIVLPESVRFSADEELRYIGKDENMGNYDRIFYDTTGYSDNFIIHMVQDMDMYAPMKAIEESYDTFDNEIDNDSVNVSHA